MCKEENKANQKFISIWNFNSCHYFAKVTVCISADREKWSQITRGPKKLLYVTICLNWAAWKIKPGTAVWEGLQRGWWKKFCALENYLLVRITYNAKPSTWVKIRFRVERRQKGFIVICPHFPWKQLSTPL